MKSKNRKHEHGAAEETGNATAADAAGSPSEPRGTEPETPPSATETPAGDLAAMRDYDKLNEKFLRLMAEYDNYRKRTQRERDQLYQCATEDLMRELLPILDNLDRATEHRNNGLSHEEYVRGIATIEDQLRKVLAHAGLTAMQVVGQPFDPALHEAVLQMPSDDHPSGSVTQEVQKGYTLRGNVLRHAKVVVSK